MKNITLAMLTLLFTSMPVLAHQHNEEKPFRIGIPNASCREITIGSGVFSEQLRQAPSNTTANETICNFSITNNTPLDLYIDVRGFSKSHEGLRIKSFQTKKINGMRRATIEYDYDLGKPGVQQKRVDIHHGDNLSITIKEDLFLTIN